MRPSAGTGQRRITKGSGNGYILAGCGMASFGRAGPSGESGTTFAQEMDEVRREDTKILPHLREFLVARLMGKIAQKQPVFVTAESV